MMASKKKRTTHVRVYKEDWEQIKTRFPNTNSASFFHEAVRSNPFIQLEAILRKNDKKKK